MAKRITITDTQGVTTETTVTDDATAREFEDLPFEAPHITMVTVTEDDRRARVEARTIGPGLCR